MTLKRLRPVPAPAAPIGGLTDPRFVYVPHKAHTLEGLRERMERYRTANPVTTTTRVVDPRKQS